MWHSFKDSVDSKVEQSLLTYCKKVCFLLGKHYICEAVSYATIVTGTKHYYKTHAKASMKYPIGMQSFDQIINGGFVYVDKTDLVYKLAQGHVCFLGRPRRFGKSLLVSTLENYFLGRKELFKGLAMENLETEWKQYPVFHIDFSVGNYLNDGALDEILSGEIARWERKYGVEQAYDDFGKRFQAVLRAAHEQTGLGCVVLIDEYDKPILDVLDQDFQVEHLGKTVTLEEKHRNIMKSFYTTFKGADADLRFTFLTGVTKFSQISMFSGFNQPDDISLNRNYEAICGITKDELTKYFSEPINEFAEDYGCSYEEMLDILKRKYDGYHFGKRLIDVFNPFSILNALNQMDLGSFWFKSGTPTYLVRLLSHFNQNLNELIGKYYAASQFDDYKADIEMPLPMIYQSGYLTIKDYDKLTHSYLLDIPNNEVREGLLTILANDYLKTKEDSASWLIQSVHLLLRGNLQEFMDSLTAFLSGIPYSVRRKNDEREYERYFGYTFFLLLKMLSCYLVYREKETSQGRADCVYETPNDVYIFEFKLDGSVDAALKQIEDKGYAREYAGDSRKIHLIGVNFSSEKGTIDDWKER